jgi:hypothetical protein
LPQVRLIWPGLNGGYRLWGQTGRLPGARLSGPLVSHIFAALDQELIDVIIRLADALAAPPKSGRRFRMEAVEIAALIRPWNPAWIFSYWC